MEQKKFKKLIALGVAGCLVLGTTVVALATETSGYEAYKDAAKETAFNEHSDDNANMLFKLSDNGETLLTGSMKSGGAGADGYESTTQLNVKGRECTISTKYEAGKTTIKCGDEVKVIEDEFYDEDATVEYSYEEPEKIDKNSNSVKLAEMIADTLVGDTKSHFVKNGDTVSLSLEGAQIPELAKLGAATVIEQFSSNEVGEYSDEVYPGDKEMQAAYDCVPQLTNINVTKIVMNADIAGGTLNENDFTVVYTGVDASGATHEVEAYIAVLI